MSSNSVGKTGRQCSDLSGDHAGHDVTRVDVDGYEGAEHAARQLGQRAAHQGRQPVQVLFSGTKLDPRVKLDIR